MKRNKLRVALLMAALMMTVTAFAKKAHDVDGKVVDEKGQPLAFVNVVLLSLPDSAFVQGTVTDEDGLFSLVADKSGGVLRVSSVGYVTQYLSVTAVSGFAVQLKEDAQIRRAVPSW